VTAPRRWRARLADLGLVLASGLLALGLGEAVVRLAAPQQLIEPRPDLWMPADTVGYLFRPSVHTTINTGEGTVHVITDTASLRVGASGRVEAPRRVLLLGDSFLAALQVEHEASVAGLLERALRDSLAETVAVRNAGVAGWGPAQYLARGRALLAQERADAMVVALYLGNDVVQKRTDYLPPMPPYQVARFRLPYAPTWQAVIDAWLRPLNDMLEQRSHLFVLLKTRLRPLLMRAGLTVEYFPEEFRTRDAGSARWHVTTGICADLAALGAAHAIPVLFVLIPAPFQVEAAIFDEYVRGLGVDPDSVDVEQPTRIMRDSLAARGLEVLDLLPAFRAATADGASLYGRVDRHLSPAGHTRLADLLSPWLVDRLRRPLTAAR
jgi:lysophospholipase L1-like esterase